MAPWCALAFVLVAAACPALAETASEYQLKAAFLYKFASFVEWPPADAEAPICIGILGSDEFGELLQQTVRGKRVNGREFQVEHFRSVAQATHCEIVFISASERRSLAEILGQLQGKPILTVSELPGFCEKGGAINLAVVDSKLRFEINPDAGDRAGLRFSSKLLSLAKIVRGAP